MATSPFVENNYQKHLEVQINVFLQIYCTSFDNVGQILCYPKFFSKIKKKNSSNNKNYMIC